MISSVFEKLVVTSGKTSSSRPKSVDTEELVSFLAIALRTARCLPVLLRSESIFLSLAYAAADVVISRSGASSISELCAAHKAAIFVPSPNVTEDHQTHNAMALVNKDAGMIVKDGEAVEKLMETACGLIEDPEKIALIEKNVAVLAKRDAAMTIAEYIYKTIK